MRGLFAGRGGDGFGINISVEKLILIRSWEGNETAKVKWREQALIVFLRLEREILLNRVVLRTFSGLCSLGICGWYIMIWHAHMK